MPEATPLTPEMLVNRLGDYLVEKKLITNDDLLRALIVQQQKKAAGKPKILGQILIDMGLVERTDLDQAVAEQILKLRNILQDANQQLERRVEERTAELQKALLKLSELNQLKSNIIANVSHEFRTPLTHCKGYLDLMGDHTLGPLTAQQEDAIRIMQKSADKLQQLIEEMIRFSTMSRGEFTLRLAPMDVHSVCKVQVQRCLPTAQSRGMTLDLLIHPNLPYVKADEEKISWVLLQLIDNALKFTNEKGRVVVSAEREGSFVKVAVTDNGIGIPSDRIIELFEPFHQLDEASNRRYGGTGLGLALVGQIIEAHGSIIRVYSKVNQGSRFEFLLPCMTDGASTAPPFAIPADGNG
jgi:signal transduction histidine kinase